MIQKLFLGLAPLPAIGGLLLMGVAPPVAVTHPPVTSKPPSAGAPRERLQPDAIMKTPVTTVPRVAPIAPVTSVPPVRITPLMRQVPGTFVPRPPAAVPVHAGVARPPQ